MFFRHLPLALLVIVPLAGCAVLDHNPPPLADPGTIDYVLGPGDRLRITVYANEENTTESTINDHGTVATPHDPSWTRLSASETARTRLREQRSQMPLVRKENVDP